MINNYILYLLVNTHNLRSYLGVTNNPSKRIRQHNCEISGGAKYTKCFKGEGEWKYYLQIRNLDKHLAFSLERKIKNTNIKFKGKNNIENRVHIILSVLENLPQKEIIYL